MGCRGRDCMVHVIGFTMTYASSAYHSKRCAEIGSSFSAAGVEPTWERTYLYLFTLGIRCLTPL
jgi:hypothetical protein